MSKYSVACILAVLLTAPAVLAANSEKKPDKKPAGDVSADFLGTWHVTSATNSFILSIQSEGQAVFILIQKGAHGIDEVTWRPMPGGILIEGYPRFRFWKGRHPNEARVEMEPLRPELAESSLLKFPATFFMRRVNAKRQFKGSPEKRPVPEGWKKATLPAEWDKTAGKRRKVAAKQ